MPAHEVNWTKDKKKSYLKAKGVRCPDCKSDDIAAEPLEADGDTAFSEVSCKKCGAHWGDLYQLVDVR